ncbi:MAG TPA: hypothetical protein VJU59_16535 [Paraburkholderia sp.]|nr:hypothetical protein [Paraburkholderia sp.]
MNWCFAACMVSISTSVALTGCVSVQQKSISQDSAAVMRGKTVVVDAYENPGFTAMTPGKAALGLIGAGLMISEGHSFIHDNQIADPAVAIGNGLAQELATKYAVVVKTTSDVKPLTTDAIDAIVAQYPDSDLIMDSRTLNWAYSYFPDHWGTYRLMYTAKIRLIDARTKTVLAEGLCKQVPDYSPDMPDYDTLTGNGAAWAKAKLSSYAESCASEFAASSLGLPKIAHQAAMAQPTTPQAH